MAVVLIVDDEFGIMKLLEDVLTDEGHRVLTASTAGRPLSGQPRRNRPWWSRTS